MTCLALLCVTEGSNDMKGFMDTDKLSKRNYFPGRL